MAIGFKVELSDLTIELTFERPDFVFLGTSSSRFVNALFPLLDKYGVTPHDVVFANTNVVGDRNVNVNIRKINAGVKLAVGKVEVGFNDFRTYGVADAQSVFLAAVSALSQVESGNKVAGYMVTMNVHGALATGTSADFINGYFKTRPDGLGGNTGGALGFYYGASGPRSHLAVIVDGSVLVQGGLFLRVNFGYDAKKIGPDEVVKAGRQQLGKAISALGLTQSGLDL